MKRYFLTAFLLFAVTVIAQERLVVNWPEVYNFKPVPARQTFINDGFKDYVTIIQGFSEGGRPIEGSGFCAQVTTIEDFISDFIMMEVIIMRNTLKSRGYDDTVTVIESDTTGKNPWILYTYSIKKESGSISALCYTITGDKNTYRTDVFITAESFEGEQLKEWSAVLKNSKLINK